MSYQTKMMNTSSCSQFQTKSEIAARTGQSTINSWRKRGTRQLYSTTAQKVAKTKDKLDNKSGTGQRPAP